MVHINIGVEMEEHGFSFDMSQVAEFRYKEVLGKLLAMYIKECGDKYMLEEKTDPKDPNRRLIVILIRGIGVHGIPLPVSVSQANAVLAHARKTREECEVFDAQGDKKELYVLTQSGSRRTVANTRFKYLVGKKFGCSPVIEGDELRWTGVLQLEVGGDE